MAGKFPSQWKIPRATSKLQKPDHGILMPIDAPNPKHLPNVFEQIMLMLTALKRYLCLRFRTASLLVEYCHFPCLRVERFKKKTPKWKLTRHNGKEREKIKKNMQSPAVLGVAARSLENPKPIGVSFCLQLQNSTV